jgi:outer membrane translocation and assembly module TamA
MTRKPDTIGYREFNRLTDHSDTHHDPLPSEVLFDDENTDQLEETLMGMEYELEELDEVREDLDDEDDEDSLEFSDNVLEDDEDEDDINADITDEIDESAQYEGHHINH